MFENNYLAGNLKTGEVIKDSWAFYRKNFSALMSISLIAVGAMLIYEAMIIGFAVLNFFSDQVFLIVAGSLLMFPVILIGIYILSIAMVSMLKRISGLLFNERIGFKQSLKGTPLASIKVLGVSMLGGMVMELPMLGLIPVGIGIGVFAGFNSGNIPLEGLFITGLIAILVIFFAAFIVWALYVGAHLIVVICSIVLDYDSSRWFQNARKLLKGKIKKVISMIIALYGIMFVLILPVTLITFFATLNGGNYFIFMPISLGFTLIVFLFVYPFIMSSMLIMYHRLKAEYAAEQAALNEPIPVEADEEPEVI